MTRVLLGILALSLVPLPEEQVLVNKAKDIHVLSDRPEPIRDYFQRNHLVVGGMLPEEMTKLLAAKAPLENVFVSYTSFNDDPGKTALFGTALKLAPPSPTVAKLLRGEKPDGQKTFRPTIVFLRDAKDAGLYHPVGYTTRSSVAFFDHEEKDRADGYSQKDLRFKGK